MIMNYRERKSVINIFKVLMPVAFIILCVCPSWNNMNGNAIASNNPNEIIDTSNKEVQQLLDPVNTFDYAGNDYLEKDAVKEINKLVNKYYKAELELDFDTLEGLVSDIEQININKLQAQTEIIESIDNIICYTIAGDVEGTYRVYVYYDMKIRGIDTSAPALSALYVTMSSDGGYIVYLSELDSETQDFIMQSDESEEVIILKALVDERFNSVLDSDKELKELVKKLNNPDNNNSDTNNTESSEPESPDTLTDEATAAEPVTDASSQNEPVTDASLSDTTAQNEPVPDASAQNEPVPAAQPSEPGAADTSTTE